MNIRFLLLRRLAGLLVPLAGLFALMDVNPLTQKPQNPLTELPRPT